MQVPADSITGLVSIRDSGWHGLASTTCEWQEPLGRLWKGFGMRVMTPEHGAAWRRQWLIALTLLHAKSSGLWRFGAMETHAVASIEMHSGRADLEK